MQEQHQHGPFRVSPDKHRSLQKQARNTTNSRGFRFNQIVITILFFIGLWLCSVLLLIWKMPVKQISRFDASHGDVEASNIIRTRKSSIAQKGSTEESSSACLLVCDDNHFLIEWLAYHYHTLNLRHVIMNSDPSCQTSPSEIVNRWQNKMKIELWGEDDFEVIPEGSEGTEEPAHRSRQRQFIMKCLTTLKEQSDDGYVFLGDADEFITINPDLHKKWKKKHQVPSIREPGSVLTLLQNITFPDDHVAATTPCIPIHRWQFGAAESPIETVQKGATPLFADSATKFHTLRWRKYGSKSLNFKTILGEECHPYRAAGPNKAVVDLKRLRLQDLKKRHHEGNPHSPIEFCTDENLFELDTALVMFHYIGTLEQWLSRVTDARGISYRMTRYQDISESMIKDESDDLRPWLEGFVESVGEVEALRLLKDVGELPKSNRDLNVLLQNITAKEDNEFKVGDVVQYIFNDDWTWAQIWYSMDDNVYHHVFLEDCSPARYILHKDLRPANVSWAWYNDDNMTYTELLEFAGREKAKRKKRRHGF